MTSNEGCSERLVLSVGQICADLVTSCDHYPEEDTQVRVAKQTWQKGGNAGNFAEVLSYLGTKAEFFGTFPNIDKMKPEILGGSAAARYCLAELDRAGVEYKHIAVRDCPNFPSSSIVLIAKKREPGQSFIIEEEKSCPMKLCRDLDELNVDDFSSLNMKDYSWVHFEGRPNVDVIRKAIEKISMGNLSLSEEKKTKLSVELELPHHDGLMSSCALVDLVVISRYFALHRGFKTAKDCVEGFRSLLKPGGEVVCSWGELGAACASNNLNDKAVLIPSLKPNKVVDTLGAGDTFQAALIHGRLNGLSLANSVKYSCEVSSKKISSHGFESVRGMGLTFARSTIS